MSCSTCYGTGIRPGSLHGERCGVCHGTGIDSDPPALTVTLSRADCQHLIRTGAFNHIPGPGLRDRIYRFAETGESS